MNEDQYRKVCDICDRVLLTPEQTIERTAIAWLHVLNEHPVNLSKYNDLFEGGIKDPWVGVKSLLHQTKQLMASYRQPYSAGRLLDSVDVIFVSHLLNEAQAGASEDFYFGSLPEDLRKKGLSSTVVLRNHTEIDLPTFSSSWSAKMAPRILLSNTLGVWEELVLRKRLHRTAVQLRAEARQTRDTLHRRALFSAAEQALSSTSISTLRIYDQIANLVKRLNPGVIVVTYEGHAWERLSFAAARSVAPRVRCVGYHHTIMFPNQHAARRLLGSEFDPDVILTAGDITRRMFSKDLKAVKVATLGTHRRETHRVKFEPDSDAGNGMPACLVIPDGTVEECLFLFDFTLAVAIQAPEIHFVLRMHPVLPFDSVAIKDPRLKNLPSNVSVSDASIAKDFSRCRWALYRGSNASIHAVLSGLRPFYVVRPGEMMIDPLHEICNWRCVITEPSDFISQVTHDLQSDHSILEAQLEGAKEYCNKYFMQTNVDALYHAMDA